jgi:transposase-like protein
MVKLKVPKLRTIPFESAIIDRYRRRECSVEEALMEMYLAGVSVRRVEDITEALWGTRVSAGVVSKLNQELYDKIDTWRNRKIEGSFPYVYLDGIVLKRTWADEIRNVSILVAFGVNDDGYREILGACEGAKEDKSGWGSFIGSLKDRGLAGVRLFISDKCMGLVESLGEYYPEAQWQRCSVHFYRNVFTNVPSTKVKDVAAMLKAIHAQEDREASIEKAEQVIEKLKVMKLVVAAKTVEEGIRETLTYTSFPREHWRSIRTNNPMERIMREIRRRTRVVGNFPDGRSALMLVTARLRYIAGREWGTKRYMDMNRLAGMASYQVLDA